MNIWFIHPDLGIGGAERLVVDAAVGLQQLGHTVTVITSYRDKSHCFDEARDGTLNVHVRGNTLIPPNIGHRFSILCAILRQLHLSISLRLDPLPTTSSSSSSSSSTAGPDIIFIDQLSVSIPLLRALYPSTKILFYCHFPDKLLSPRTSYIKSLYRLPFDFIEGYTTGKAHLLIVNSQFTSRVFAKSFSGIASVPKVVYPSVDINPHPPPPSSSTTGTTSITPSPPPPPKTLSDRKIILSINRFERKKAITLAITAFSRLPPPLRAQTRLIIAGGYDPRNNENMTYHTDLAQLCDSLKLQHATCRNYITALDLPSTVDVLFLLSVPASWKGVLLSHAKLLVYTPENEHFGIVPLEAMGMGVPVLATDTGGPLESIVEGVTGWLRPAKTKEWAKIMQVALFDLPEEERRSMGEAGKKRVKEVFSKEKMAESFQTEMYGLLEPEGGKQAAPLIGAGEIGLGLAVGVAVVAVAGWYFLSLL
ncbi:hypothetical protein DFH27DRAFT_481090 [Peziza echinospora]|nr:hypothetical protein DFH27DRAFT_481090 [Peziza echinospora]